MLKLKIQKRLRDWEKKRFMQLTELIENADNSSIDKIRRELEKKLGRQYELCQTGQRLWIYRKFNNSAVAVISETLSTPV